MSMNSGLQNNSIIRQQTESYKFMGTMGAFIIVEDTQDVGGDHVTTPMSRVRCVASPRSQEIIICLPHFIQGQEN